MELKPQHMLTLQLVRIASMGADMLRSRTSVLGYPVHAITQTPYRGINALMLMATRKDLMDNGFVTENDILVHEGSLKRINRGTTLFIGKNHDTAFKVYPIEDTQKLEVYQSQTQWVPIEQRIGSIIQWFLLADCWSDDIRKYIQGTYNSNDYTTVKDRKGWSPNVDLTKIALIASYWLRTNAKLEEYHHQRKEAKSSDPRYEALVVEISAAMIAAKHGFHYDPRGHHSIYFVSLMKENPNVLISASMDAQLIIDFLDNKVYDALAQHELW